MQNGKEKVANKGARMCGGLTSGESGKKFLRKYKKSIKLLYCREEAKVNRKRPKAKGWPKMGASSRALHPKGKKR